MYNRLDTPLLGVDTSSEWCGIWDDKAHDDEACGIWDDNLKAWLAARACGIWDDKEWAELSRFSSASLIWRRRISICLSSAVITAVAKSGVEESGVWGVDPYQRSYLCLLRRNDAIFSSCSIFHFKLRQWLSSWRLSLNRSTAVFFTRVGFPCQVATPLFWVGWRGWVDGGGEREVGNRGAGESKVVGFSSLVGTRLTWFVASGLRAGGGGVISHWGCISSIPLKKKVDSLPVLHLHQLASPPLNPTLLHPAHLHLLHTPIPQVRLHLQL